MMKRNRALVLEVSDTGGVLVKLYVSARAEGFELIGGQARLSPYSSPFS